MRGETVIVVSQWLLVQWGSLLRRLAITTPPPDSRQMPRLLQGFPHHRADQSNQSVSVLRQPSGAALARRPILPSMLTTDTPFQL